MSNLINIGVSGLNAALSGMTTAGHNVANASTAGYSRQQVVQTSGTPIATTGGYLGTGAQVTTVQRVYSQFMTNQVASAQSRQSELEAYSNQISQLDNLLADSEAGLTPAMSSFFTNVQGLASNAGSNAASSASRQTLLSGAETLVARFSSLNDTMNAARDSVNFQVQTSASTISAYSKQLAEINGQISYANAVGMGQSPNDLYDQRDQLLASLGKEIGVTTTSNTDGSMNVFVGNGVPLVMGNHAYAVSAATSTSDPKQMAIYLEGENGNSYSLPQEQITGGSLGGVMSFVSKTLNPAQNRLGQIAVGLAETFNNQHALGQDMNGNVGKAFFNLGAIPVNANTQNAPGTSDSLISVSYDSANVSKLTTSDYKVTYDGSAFQVVRSSDNQTLGSLSTGSTSLTVDGLTFNYNSALSSASAGDSFLVQPTRYAASKLSVALTDPSQIASAAATKTMADTANVGKGQISTGTMYNSANLASLFPASPAKTTMTFDGANLNFSGLPSTAAIQVTHSDGTVSQYAAGTTTVPFIPGESIALGTSFAASSPAPTGDYSFKISGSMAVNDKFYLSRNTGASADNSNALALGNLQTTSVLNGGKETYQGAYSQLVGVVGNTAKDVSVNLSAQGSLVTQLETNQQSISGVNLDEVAANLIRYQQAYQAAGKLIQVSSTLFNQILNM